MRRGLGVALEGRMRMPHGAVPAPAVETRSRRQHEVDDRDDPAHAPELVRRRRHQQHTRGGRSHEEQHPLVHHTLAIILMRSDATAAMTKAPGMVRIHAQTTRLATPQRTAERRRAAPTPTMAPVMVCVVDTGMPERSEE